MPNNITQQDLLFPTDSVKIIAGVLKKYGLEETQQIFFEKFQKDQESIGSIVAMLIKKVATQELQQKDMPAILKEKLGIPAKKAKDLSKDLEIQILSKVRPRERDITTAINKKEAKLAVTKKQIEKQPATVQEKKKSPIKDTYRELIKE